MSVIAMASAPVLNPQQLQGLQYLTPPLPAPALLLIFYVLPRFPNLEIYCFVFKVFFFSHAPDNSAPNPKYYVFI